jgi:glycosyltransferase involved in cell wall biosynthesis
MTHFSIVLPCRDQGDHIGPVIERYAGALEAIGRPFEIVVVPNACVDDTAAVVARVAARDPRIGVVDNPKGGWGLSVLCGLRASKGEVLCYTNSARTEPNDVVLLYELYVRSAPCVAKVRRVKRNNAKREIGSWLYNVEGRLLLGVECSDVNGTPKILSRSTYEQAKLVEEGDLIDMELLAKAHRAKIPVVELEVEGFSRHGGKSRTNWAAAYRMYAGVFRLRGSLR